MGAPIAIYHLLRRLLEKLVDPLRADEQITQFTLSIPEAQTTTVDSVQGWRNRPPAVLECPGCGGPMYQRRAGETIDCSACWRTYPETEFSDHGLLGMICPRCDSEMTHGIRHPQVFDVPEWATCTDCQYHWDLDHWF